MEFLIREKVNRGEEDLVRQLRHLACSNSNGFWRCSYGCSLVCMLTNLGNLSIKLLCQAASSCVLLDVLLCFLKEL